MQARERRTDDYTEELQSKQREQRETVRIDPPVPLDDVEAARERRRLITVHEGPVHRRHVGRETPVPRLGDAIEPLAPQDLLGEDDATRELDVLPDLVLLDEGEDDAVPELDAAALRPASEVKTVDEDDDIVSLPLRRAAPPQIKLECGLQRAVDAHRATTDMTGQKRSRRDRPTEQLSTQEMTPVSGQVERDQWVRTAVGPMPTGPQPRPARSAGVSPWIVVASVLVLLAAIAGGWLLYRAFEKASGSLVIAVSAQYVLVTALLSWLLLNEHLGLRRIIGIVLAVVAIVLLSWEDPRESPAAQPSGPARSVTEGGFEE